MREAALLSRLCEWRELLRRQIPQARQILKLLLDGPTRFHPRRDPKGDRSTGRAAVGKLIEGSMASPCSMASPTGYPPEWNANSLAFEGHVLSKCGPQP